MIVAETAVPKGGKITKVLTVYLNGPPHLYETMVFGGPCDRYCERALTYSQAAAMHAKVVHMVQAGAEGESIGKKEEGDEMAEVDHRG